MTGSAALEFYIGISEKAVEQVSSFGLIETAGPNIAQVIRIQQPVDLPERTDSHALERSADFTHKNQCVERFKKGTWRVRRAALGRIANTFKIRAYEGIGLVSQHFLSERRETFGNPH